MSRFYNKQAWQRLRKAKLIQNPTCEYCAPGTVTPATEVDHKTAISKGGSEWDWSNLASVCHECHSRKTRHIDQLGKSRVPTKGVDPCSGLPLDSQHWWAKQ